MYKLYYFIFYSARTLNPALPDEQAADGSFWVLNFIFLFITIFFFNLISYSLKIDCSEVVMFSSWLLVCLFNYWLIMHKAHWRTIILNKPEGRTGKGKLIILIIAVILLMYLIIIFPIGGKR
jgi:hypothetical protein